MKQFGQHPSGHRFNNRPLLLIQSSQSGAVSV
jgi:hypothetical protein